MLCNPRVFSLFTEGCEFDSDEIFRCWDLNARSFAWEPGFGDGLFYSKEILKPGFPVIRSNPVKPERGTFRFQGCFPGVSQHTFSLNNRPNRHRRIKRGTFLSKWEIFGRDGTTRTPR